MTTPLRAKYIRDLAIRGRAERTQQSYSRYVSELARYYQRSPELISYQEVADWLYYLIKERELSASSVNIAVNAVRFLYGVTLERNSAQLMASVPRMKHAIRRAEIYARSEVEAILSAPRQPRDRVFLMTVYACGLRLAEARHLKTTDIRRLTLAKPHPTGIPLINGIPGLGLNRFAVCSGSRFREQPGFQSNPSLLPPERRCEEKAMLSATQTHLAKELSNDTVSTFRRCMTEDMQRASDHHSAGVSLA
jgi:Phage integrase, N-terminal SAM-like domain